MDADIAFKAGNGTDGLDFPAFNDPVRAETTVTWVHYRPWSQTLPIGLSFRRLTHEAHLKIERLLESPILRSLKRATIA